MLAKRSGYSEYYFSHKFKEEMGTSIHDYILKEKIDQAKLLLSGTTENIQTISDNLSFSNRSYFYTCFQKLVGMSPSEYRAQNHRI
ncbi:helix-turn-helix transcriptional regulator [Blautia pseudococcoides]|uniref:helix-turn-helix transcriptional regulator n=1 Tax=Blautia pseudococcoides TaxID=1796616 RepID=UPI001FA8229D|nr:helix-turn-helix transcriptional regulator [Blautia pseudococcoides]